MPSQHIYVQPEYAEWAIGSKLALSDDLAMAKKRHFLMQWRKHRGLSQVQLAERIGVTQGQLSKIENLKKPYDQDFLEAAAEALRCEVVDLLIRDPSQKDSIWSIWDQLAPAEQEKVVGVAKVLKGTGTDG